MGQEETQAVLMVGEAALYASCFLAAAGGSVAVTFRDNRYRDCFSLAGLACTAGIVASFFVAVLISVSGGDASHVPLYITASGVIGVSGKWAEARIMRIFEVIADKMLSALGADIEEDDNENQTGDS